MKALKTVTLICVMIMAVTTGCKKEEVKFYDGPEAVYFNEQNLQNTAKVDKPYGVLPLYNFAYQPPGTTQGILRASVSITGRLANYDRTVNIRVVADSTTAVAGEDYEILPTTIKAGAVKDSVRVIVKKTPGLKNQKKRLLLEIAPSADFSSNINTDAQTTLRRLMIEIADKGGKPENWDGIFAFGFFVKGIGLGEVFGPYSDVKFQLVIQVFGTPNITSIYDVIYGKKPLQFNFGVWRSNIFKLQQILIDYKLKNGSPLLDENGKEVIIPPITNTFIK